MDNVVDQYHREVETLKVSKPAFPNRNLDTGAPTSAGQYKLADEAYSQLVRRLAHNHFARTTPALRANILDYFASGPAQNNIKPREWRATQIALKQLKAGAARSQTDRGRQLEAGHITDWATLSTAVKSDFAGTLILLCWLL
jgi:hypothetical protein